MKNIRVLVISLFLISCGSQEKESNNEKKLITDIPCPVSWEEYKPTKNELELNVNNGVIASKINDSTTQQILYGKVWFEMINPRKLDNGSKICYLRNYRTDGSLESEGYGVYNEHPVADFSMDGVWKFYGCDGKLKNEAKYDNGKRL